MTDSVAAPTLSVAICTRDRPEKLRRALESLATQTEAPDEVLVVDNAATNDATARVVAAFPRVRYVREPVPGLDFARNRALREAVGDVVAFVDDDAVADTGWSAAIRAAFAERPNLGVCTGRIEALTVAGDGQRLFEANGGFSRGHDRVLLPRDAARPLHGRRAPLIAWAVSVGCGCSFAVRRTLALELGGFDEALDLGPALPGGGDHDMLWRVLGAGREVMYEPAALAWHEHRPDKAAAIRQITGHQRALVAFLTKHVAATHGRDRLQPLGFLAWRMAKPAVRIARRLVGRDPLSVSALVRMWVECWRGLVAYSRATRVARVRREQQR